jgi:hypothetical protein
MVMTMESAVTGEKFIGQFSTGTVGKSNTNYQKTWSILANRRFELTSASQYRTGIFWNLD